MCASKLAKVNNDVRLESTQQERIPDAQGGALVSLIHGYTDNGDPFIRKFTDSLLEDVSTDGPNGHSSDLCSRFHLLFSPH